MKRLTGKHVWKADGSQAVPTESPIEAGAKMPPSLKQDGKNMEKGIQIANTSALVCLHGVAGSECCFLVVAASSRWGRFHGSASHMASLGDGEGARRGRMCL